MKENGSERLVVAHVEMLLCPDCGGCEDCDTCECTYKSRKPTRKEGATDRELVSGLSAEVANNCDDISPAMNELLEQVDDMTVDCVENGFADLKDILPAHNRIDLANQLKKWNTEITKYMTSHTAFRVYLAQLRDSTGLD